MGKSRPTKRLHKLDVTSPTGLASIKDTEMTAELTPSEVSSLDTITERVSIVK